MATKTSHDTYRARRAVQIALEVKNKWPIYVPRAESRRLLAADGIGISTFRQARRLVSLASKDIIEKVLKGEMSLYKAHELTTRGNRIKCVACDGHGFIFDKYDPKNR